MISGWNPPLRLTLDLEAHQLRDGKGESISLTSMEFDLLKAFAENPNKVLNRDQLLSLSHNRDWDPFDRSIDIRITRLRRKIEVEPSKPQIIKRGLELGVDYGLTHSCYDPLDEAGRPCGRCDSCRLRQSAFDQLNMTDPLRA